MREILFRGKRVDNGEWETGSLVITRAGLSDERVYIADKMTGYYTPVIPETVGQYTGSTDKNGVKIFEGDVIRYVNANFIVEYVSGFASFNTKNLHNTHYAPWFTPITTKGMYVIGNIYDNPELLEENESKVKDNA